MCLLNVVPKSRFCEVRIPTGLPFFESPQSVNGPVCPVPGYMVSPISFAGLFQSEAEQTSGSTRKISCEFRWAALGRVRT